MINHIGTLELAIIWFAWKRDKLNQLYVLIFWIGKKRYMKCNILLPWTQVL